MPATATVSAGKVHQFACLQIDRDEVIRLGEKQQPNDDDQSRRALPAEQQPVGIIFERDAGNAPRAHGAKEMRQPKGRCRVIDAVGANI